MTTEKTLIRVERKPPYWCPRCCKTTWASIRSDGEIYVMVCPDCGYRLPGDTKKVKKEFNPSRR